MVTQRVCLHDLHRLELLQPGLLGNLVLPLVGIMLQMADISDIAHIAHLVSEMLQELEKHVISHSRPRMAEMGVAINGRAADIHPDMARMHRLEKLFLVRKGIGQI